MEEDKDSRRISILLPKNTLSVGETAEFSITREEGPFTTCVPLSALREENGRSFVYVTDTENTILGEQLVARKVEVTVRDKNNSYAALEEGSLSSEQQVIISTDREVTEAVCQKCRVMKGKNTSFRFRKAAGLLLCVMGCLSLYDCLCGMLQENPAASVFLSGTYPDQGQVAEILEKESWAELPTDACFYWDGGFLFYSL